MALTKPRAYQIYDIDYKQAVRVVTLTNITLSGGAPNSVDSVNLSLNDRILVTGQSSASQNGIYYVTTLGSGSNGTWARSIDTNTTGELLAGTIVMVTEGAIYADTQWKLTTNDPITIGSTALTFIQNFQGPILVNGTSNVSILSANANVTVSVAGTSNVAVFASTGEYVTGLISATGNITGGNLITAGKINATGTITSDGGTSSTAFAVGNSAVSNVALGFFPTAGTRGDYAIRDYSTVFSNMYFDVCIGGTPNGAFQFRSSSSYNQFANINSLGINTPLAVTATGIVSGSELTSTNSLPNEGGQINLALPSSGSTLVDGVIIDVYQNNLRFYERGGTNRGAYINLSAASAGVGSNILAGGGGGTPGGSNTNVQFNDGGTFGGNGQFTYDKVTNTLTAGIIAANNNGAGTNFKVGDDAWIGDINTADTFRITGQQNGANAYIVFGNADGAQLGRAGTGPLTYAGAFTATGNVTGGNLTTAGILTVNSGNAVSAIVNGGGNGVGNIGSSTKYFNTVFAKATSAQYADLAEMYQGDQTYMPGTVVEFGGTHEVTITKTESSTRIAGVVSTNPSYLMNSGLNNLNSVPVALTGRVPCQVLGPVRKGDRLVSSIIPGVAQALDESTYRPGCMIGKSLEDWPEASVKSIEVVVGRL